ESVARPPVARLLHPDVAARRQQNARREVEGLLRAAHDEDLLGLADDTARRSDVRRDRLAERLIARGGAVLKERGARRPRMAREETPPRLHRKTVGRDPPHVER